MDSFKALCRKTMRIRGILVMPAFLAAICMVLGCKKLVQVGSPTTSLTSDNVYTTDATAAAVLTGIYSTLATSNPMSAQTINSISLTAALSADELTLYGGAANANTALAQFYLNDLTSATTGGTTTWDNFYYDLYIVNIALEGLSTSTSLTPAVKQQLMGEAKFLRAFFYFYLVNLYGPVPLALTSDYTITAVLARSPQTNVYQQIIADLASAKSLLADGYVASDAMTSTTERVRPDKWAAMALLARTYLFTGDWSDAAATADSVINQSALYNLDTLNGAFLKNSTETIWSLQPVNIGWNTEDAMVFILPATGPTNNSAAGGYPVYISPQLLGSFEVGDKRRTNWVDSVTVDGVTYYYPYKYKSATLNAPVTEYTMVLRLGELYLIRSEAEAEGAGGGINGAVADLNVVRARAGLPAYAGPTDQTSVLNAILHERQVELFTEWGHRWLDLKRTGNVNGVMNVVAPEKGTIWNQDWQWYPLPLYDIQQDPNLVQNQGY
jgi:hypothetical protein